MLNMNKEKFERYITQMNSRLFFGKGKCNYLIGVSDNGNIKGLKSWEILISLFHLLSIISQLEKVYCKNIKIVLDAMYGSTNEQFGTSFRSRHKDKKYRYAGKTGTSQVRRITEKDRELDLDTSEIEYKNRDHALFVAFAPYDKPKYAISVLVEHGGSGSKAAAPIAKKVIKKVLERDSLRQSVNKFLGEPV